MSTQLRAVRDLGSEMDRILAQTRADEARRTAHQLGDAILRLAIAVIEAQHNPGAPVATVTVDGPETVGSYQLPKLAADLITAAIQRELVEYLATTGLDPELIHRLAGGDASASTALDHHRPALRAIQGGAAR
jgi:hypothetical protein